MISPSFVRTMTFAAALAGFAALTGGLLLHRDVDAWNSVRAEADAIEDQLVEIRFDRDVLWGDAEEGAAMETYRAATKLVSSGALGYPNLGLLLDDLHGPVEGEGLGELLESPSVRDALGLLRSGAHQTDASPFRYPSLADAHRPRLVSRRTLVLLARAHARSLSAEGEDLDAARWLLDAMQLGLDSARSPLLVDRAVGLALVRIGLEGGNNEPIDLSFLGEDGLREIHRALPDVQREIRLLPLAGAGDFVRFIEGMGEALPDPVGDPFKAFQAYGRSAKLGAEYLHLIEEMDEACAISTSEAARVADLLCERTNSSQIEHAARSIQSVRALGPDLASYLDVLHVEAAASSGPRSTRTTR